MMYTYIYTEKPMEFYKEGRVLTVAPNTTLDLGPAQYNHKAALIVSLNPLSTAAVNLKFYTKGTKSTSVTFTAVSAENLDVITNNFTNNLIPVRLAEITNSDLNYSIKVTLFN